MYTNSHTNNRPRFRNHRLEIIQKRSNSMITSWVKQPETKKNPNILDTLLTRSNCLAGIPLRYYDGKIQIWNMAEMQTQWGAFEIETIRTNVNPGEKHWQTRAKSFCGEQKGFSPLKHSAIETTTCVNSQTGDLYTHSAIPLYYFLYIVCMVMIF